MNISAQANHKDTTNFDVGCDLNNSVPFKQNRFLTKSRIKLALGCPTKLAYTSDKSYKNTKSDDSFLAALADGGFQVGELAKLMYPGGTEIMSKDHDEAEAETSALLQNENVILFEPAIRFGNLFVRIDILIKTGDSFELIEVKAKSIDPSNAKIVGARGAISSEMLPYIQDVAFQKYVLQCAIPSATITTSLLMADKTKRATVDGLNQLFHVERRGQSAQVIIDQRAHYGGCGESVLTKLPTDTYVDMVMAQGVAFPGGVLPLPEAAAVWATAYQSEQRILPMIGSHCAKCEFRANPSDGLNSGVHQCWADAGVSREDFDRGTVLDIYNFRGKDKLIAQGIYKLSQVNADDIKVKRDGNGLTDSERQAFQVFGIPAELDSGGYYLDSGLMKAAMESWKFPFHFFDCETASVALPLYKGMRPYEQVAFQFSHHVMQSDGSVEHATEFLMAEPGEFPNYHFARALKACLDKDAGTVFMWSPHENTILNRIVVQLSEDENPPADKDELIQFLTSLTKGGDRAMADLCALARKSFFHPASKGSSSIKKLLPAVLSTSQFLRHKYSQPTYGAAGGMSSKNFANWTWWREHDGVVIEPYKLLADAEHEMLGSGPDDEGAVEIAEGGAAAAAFSRLQYELLDDVERTQITRALLRYCELDTLAMVMIVEAWRAWLKGTAQSESATSS
jgi:hypothetical protein